MEITEKIVNHKIILQLGGRFDGQGAEEISKELNKLTIAGHRIILLDFAEVNFLSSAGLRPLIATQKILKKYSGELIICSLTKTVQNVFEISGFDLLFTILRKAEDFVEEKIIDNEEIVQNEEVKGEINYSWINLGGKKGNLNIFGEQNNIYSKGFVEEDLIEVMPSRAQYGTGLAAIGDEFIEFKNQFGESMIFDKNFFVFPASNNSYPDFILSSELKDSFTYKFLYGFGFTGSFSKIVNISNPNGFVHLNDLKDFVNRHTENNIAGFAFIGESKGLYGMNLKKIPLRENIKSDASIFDRKNFPDWMDFIIDPELINHVVAGVGISYSDHAKLEPKVSELFGIDINYHIHAAVFEQGLFGNEVFDFEKEYHRIINDLKVIKVQHMLGKSTFRTLTAGIIELEY